MYLPTAMQEKALDMQQSVCVTASAGTGKTFILTQRYIKCLRSGHIDAGKILALTYTDKAAAEMREKIEYEIREEFKRTGEFKEVLENIHKCSISTFHGFCASLLKEYPIEAGIEPGFTIMDDLDRSELVTTTIHDILNNPPAKLEESVIHLYRHLKPDTINANLSAILPKWHEYSPWFKKLKENPKEIETKWKDARIQYILRKREDLKNDEKIAELMGYFERAEANPESAIKRRLASYGKLLAADDLSEIIDALIDLKKLKKPDSIKNNPEIPADLLLYFIAVMKTISIYDEQLLSEDRLDFVFSVLNAFGSVVEAVYRRIALEKERASVLDFDDLLRYTSVLMENPEIVEALRKRYEYILVDEVQDNDPVLTGIVKNICGSSPKNGKLFIVGDVKQSIYGFRGADPQGFFDLMQMFSSKPVSLDTSFRTVPEILDCINDIFTDVFRDSPIEYNPILPSRTDESGSVTVLRNTNDGKADEIATAESELIASWIQEHTGTLEVYENEKKRPCRYGDIAILLRARTKLKLLKKALETYGVPYVEYKGRDFYQSQEIYDIVTVLKAAAYPEDDIALYGALRSPYFGIPDAALCASAFGSEKSLLQRLETSEDAEITSALAVLRRYQKLSHETTLVRLVNEILRSSGILSVYAALPSGSDMIANLRKFVDIVSAKSAGSAVSLPVFLKTMETCIEEMISEENSTDTEDADGADRVKILTIHTAKGLEYPVVILAFAASDNSHNDNFCFTKELGVTFKVIHPDGTEIPSFVNELTKDNKAKREDAELRRLYYVAMTRARDHLVVSMTEKKKPDPKSFIRLHEVTGGKSVCECLCSPEKTSVCGISEPDDWEEIPAAAEPEPVVYRDASDAEEYVLARGSCLHEIFAGADAAATATRYGLREYAAVFAESYETFLNCSLMKDVVCSYCELPISLGEENKRIDRLVKYRDGRYAIIDYKSGSRENVSDEMMEKYVAQLKRYAELMSGIVSCSVPAFLYFVGGKSEAERIVRVQ